MQKIYLKDYQAPHYNIQSVKLLFDLYETHCLVTSTLEIEFDNIDTKLFLNGEHLDLLSLKVNGTEYPYVLEKHGLTLAPPSKKISLEINTRIEPQKNTSLEGLYKSSDIFVTQCEAEGFRKITYFPDRPDVMSQYEVRIRADIEKYPVLLSNGDCIKSTMLTDGRHEAVWSDPHKKPCYLFALVAGNLGVLEDRFTTCSGKNVKLQIYSRHGTQDRCQHAMESLKKSMKWDEERFGREYDLSTYMIVAIDDFNAGAMENKGLNIFNSKLVFANPKTATDADYEAIESVVAHEYFHNWTGNRVTLRDWFHLSLKEGLTVFRDQEFSMDMIDRDLVRIQSVDALRSSQFAEDSGPNAHPIRPESCYAVDNFFTSTIYEKGAEIIRMMQTMVGRPGFRKGMDLYFERHDGQAVTIEDFARAISEANNENWDQFKLWYSQAGTPTVEASGDYDSLNKKYTLILKQTCELTPQEKKENKNKFPFHIPLEIALLNSKGESILLKSPSVHINSEGKSIIHLKSSEQKFVFDDINENPQLSLNRGFSAPIRLKTNQSIQDLCFLLKHDSDSFNRWESAQSLYLKLFLAFYNKDSNIHQISEPLLNSLKSVMSDNNISAALKAEILGLPSDHVLIQSLNEFSPKELKTARTDLMQSLYKGLKELLYETYLNIDKLNPQSIDQKSIGLRRLKNTCLGLLCVDSNNYYLAHEQAQKSKLMTDEQAALFIASEFEGPISDQVIELFYSKWKSESLVLNKWFLAQARAQCSQTFSRVQKLWEHPDFQKTNPNRVYSLLGGFGDNLTEFWGHPEAIEYMAQRIIEMDKINPQVTTRLASAFDVWKQLPIKTQEHTKRALHSIINAKPSPNTYEIISKALEV